MDGLPTTSGCHGGRETMQEAARAAGKSESLDRMLADYPRGPHDQPQSMCPAFGSLRVGLRMKRTATILSGSACCVYGLTFTSHFYGARRSVGYVPFNSETLVTGKLFEDIRDAVHATARPEEYDAVVIINLCVPTASGVPLDLLPKAINGVRVIGIDVPGFGVPTHAEAKDVLAGAMLRYARLEAEAGPVARPRNLVEGEPTVAPIGELFPADPPGLGALLAPMGLGLAPQLPSREWRDLYASLDSVVAAAVHPFYTATVREFRAAGRPVVGSAPVGVDGRWPGLKAIGAAAAVPRRPDRGGQERLPARTEGGAGRQPDLGPHHRSPATEGRSCWSRACWSRPGRRCPMSAPRCPARNGARPTSTGCRRAACTSSTAPRSSRTWRRCGRSGRTWRSAPHHSSRRRRRPGSRRSTSPTWSPPGR
jgi:chlorophyllide a reductase subunit Y